MDIKNDDRVQRVGKVLKIKDIIPSANKSQEEIEAERDNWCEEILDFVADRGNREKTNKYEVPIWKKNMEFLAEHLPRDEKYQDIPVLFEYRPQSFEDQRMDVIFLLAKKVIVLEFKNTKVNNESELADEFKQLDRYLGYLNTYHNVTKQKRMDVEGYLVRPESIILKDTSNADKILNKNNFCEIITKCFDGDDDDQESYDHIDVYDWIFSDVSEPPSLSEGFIELFTTDDNERIRELKDGDIGKSLSTVRNIIKATQKDDKKAVLLIDGKPGSGKTYLGMQILVDQLKAGKNDPSIEPIYISGNEALISYMLRLFQLEDPVKEFKYEPYTRIKTMLDFKDNYLKGADHHTYRADHHTYNVIIFDESQRAWDEEHSKREGCSEIEGLLRLSDDVKGSLVIVCLYGTGQFINYGEESGMIPWISAIRNHPEWTYFASPEIAEKLDKAGDINKYPALHLDTSIRTNFVDIDQWIEAFLEGADKERQKEILEKIIGEHKTFDISVTRRLATAEAYIKEKHGTDYGVLVSSYVDYLDKDKKNNKVLKKLTEGRISYTEDKKNAGAWFFDDKEKLMTAGNEFMCQGLEMDWPIVLFAGDLYLDDGVWKKEMPKSKADKLNDPEQILLNAYRVLLSRGRKGMIIMIPDDPKMDETYHFLIDIGINELKG